MALNLFSDSVDTMIRSGSLALGAKCQNGLSIAEGSCLYIAGEDMETVGRDCEVLRLGP